MSRDRRFIFLPHGTSRCQLDEAAELKRANRGNAITVVDGMEAACGGRDYDASYIPESQMYHVYLRPFQAAVNAGVGSAISAHMDLNDVPATGNRWLLHDVLREQWHFSGFVVSDANAVKSLETHHYAKDLSDVALLAFKAGVNIEMVINFCACQKNEALLHTNLVVSQ